MMIKKFTQFLIIIIAFNTSLVAMYDEGEDGNGNPIARWCHATYSSSDVIEEETSKQRYYGFGGAFCMLGAHISQNSPLAGVLTMVLGGFLCHRGWNTPAKDHFD